MDAYNTSPSPEFIMMYAAVVLPLTLIYIISAWKIYVKAGKPGWASIVPFYNILCLLRIVGKPEWWIILYFIPLANLIVSISVAIDLAKKFGKSGMFGFFGLFLFPFVGYPMLAFGSTKYTEPIPTPPTTMPPTPDSAQTPVPPVKSETTPSTPLITNADSTPANTPIINHTEQTPQSSTTPTK